VGVKGKQGQRKVSGLAIYNETVVWKGRFGLNTSRVAWARAGVKGVAGVEVTMAGFGAGFTWLAGHVIRGAERGRRAAAGSARNAATDSDEAWIL
jgi:hypothetical protein